MNTFSRKGGGDNKPEKPLQNHFTDVLCFGQLVSITVKAVYQVTTDDQLNWYLKK